MAMHIEAGPVPSYGRAAKRVWRTSHLPWLGVAVLFAAAMAMRHVVAANTDVSWLLIAGERWLDGQRLYSDIVETNPPMAVLIYVPGILIARALGMPAEIVLDGLMFAAIAASLAITARILGNSAALAPGQRWPLALLAVMVLTILPVQVFGQREHIAIIALLPALGVLALRIKQCIFATGAVVAAIECLTLAPSPAGDDFGLVLRFRNSCHQVRSVGDQLAIDAIDRLQRAFNLGWRVVFRLEAAHRGFDHFFQAGNV